MLLHHFLKSLRVCTLEKYVFASRVLTETSSEKAVYVCGNTRRHRSCAEGAHNHLWYNRDGGAVKGGFGSCSQKIFEVQLPTRKPVSASTKTTQLHFHQPMFNSQTATFMIHRTCLHLGDCWKLTLWLHKQLPRGFSAYFYYVLIYRILRVKII